MHASFCAACGGPLSPQAPAGVAPPPAATPSKKGGKPSRSGCGCVFVFAFIVAACLMVVVNTEGTREQSFAMDAHLADAIFELLAPSDVDVIVSRRTMGIHVKGSRRDVRTLTQFIAVMTQNTCSPDDPPPDGLSHWLEDRTYLLTRHKAQSLVDVLSYEHAPVFATQFGSKVEIYARPEDHKAIAAMIDILGGKPTPPARTPW
jgi:hypothetical protein